MTERKSHLDIEGHQFAGKPHVWVQWKGTDVCCDVHCECGFSGHVDGEFFYFFECPQCHQIWEVGTHVQIHKVDAVPDGTIVTTCDPHEGHGR